MDHPQIFTYSFEWKKFKDGITVSIGKRYD